MFGLFKPICPKHPLEIERDKKLVASLNSMKTLRVSGGPWPLSYSVSVGASDLKEALNKLREDTKNLVKKP